MYVWAVRYQQMEEKVVRYIWAVRTSRWKRKDIPIMNRVIDCTGFILLSNITRLLYSVVIAPSYTDVKTNLGI